MSAVFKKEFRSNLTNIIGIIFIAVMLIAFGWNFILLTFRAAYPAVEFSFVHFLGMQQGSIYLWISNGFPLITLIFASLLTMRVFPEERHQKTDILLYSLPISAGKIVMGKYLALVAIFALPFAEFLLVPVITGMYGAVNYLAAYGAILAYFLLGCAVIAVCMFVSSLTANQVVSAVGSIAAVLVLYFLPQLSGSTSETPMTALLVLLLLSLAVGAIVYAATKNPVVAAVVFAVLAAGEFVIYFVKSEWYEGLAGKIISTLGLFDKMNGFANGVVDISTYIYYISFAALFVFFTVQSFEKRRWN